MVSKIISQDPSVVVQEKNDRVQALGSMTRSKYKRHFSPASILDSCINVPATRLERRWKTAQSNRIHGYLAHFGKNHHRPLLGNKNVRTLTEKKLDW